MTTSASAMTPAAMKAGVRILPESNIVVLSARFHERHEIRNISGLRNISDMREFHTAAGIDGDHPTILAG